MLIDPKADIFEREKTSIPKILDHFAVGKLQKIIMLGQAEGMSNHNYLVVTDKGEFVIKFPVGASLESLENDLVISEQLEKVGIKSPIYRKDSQGEFIYNNGISAVVSKRIAGIHPNKIDGNIVSLIGKSQGLFHKAVSHIKNETKGWLNPILSAKLTNQENNPLVQKARKYLKEGNSIYEKNLPEGIIHGDFHLSNILLDIREQNKVLAIMDFEDSEKNLLIIDTARSLLTICINTTNNKVDKELMKHFLGGYSSVKPLTELELELIPKAIQYVGGACILWYIRNNYLTSAESTIEHVDNFLQ